MAKIYIIDDGHLFETTYKDMKDLAQTLAVEYEEELPKNKSEVWEMLDATGVFEASKQQVKDELKFGSIMKWK